MVYSRPHNPRSRQIPFLQCQKDTESARQIYTHVTNATDQKNIGFVFGAACDIILSNNLNRAGMS
jgi:hypothetical protein